MAKMIISLSKKNVERLLQTIVTILLFVLVFAMMHNVESIQGTARVVNYAGLVRGATQRMVKLEVAGQNADPIIATLDGYINGIQNGSDKLQLVRIEDKDFQDKVQLLSEEWLRLKQEIILARKVGYQNTDLVAMSERYFRLCDAMVGSAEVYTQKRTQAIKYIEIAINIMILLLLAIIVKQYITALGISRKNKELKQQIFIDKHTGLPNKNRCEQLLGETTGDFQTMGMFMFDLNNLKFVNDSLGHEEGDKLILNFSKLVRANIDEKYFVGRYGGDEFIALVPHTSQAELKAIAQKVRTATAQYNEMNAILPISYAVGYALIDEVSEPTLEALLAEADRRMYINKQETKKLTATVEEECSQHLYQMMNALEHGYKACYYCDYQNDSYRMLKHAGKLELPQEGKYSDFLTAFLEHNAGMDESIKEMLKTKLSFAYINQHLNSENSYYDIEFHDTDNAYWLAHVMLVDIDKLGRLSHFILTFTDISHTRNMEYAATHDALTDLLNRHAGCLYMEQALAQDDANEYALMIIDVDDFKKINDNFGHSMGDTVLKELAKAMRNFFPAEAIITRYGGDEFLILTKVAQDDAEFSHFMKALVSDVTKDIWKDYPDVPITVSVGAVRGKDGVNLRKLFDEADDVLYLAKRKGKNTYKIYHPDESQDE